MIMYCNIMKPFKFLQNIFPGFFVMYLYVIILYFRENYYVRA